MARFVIDTPCSRKGKTAPFVVDATSEDKAMAKVEKHVAGLWLPTQLTVRGRTNA